MEAKAQGQGQGLCLGKGSCSKQIPSATVTKASGMGAVGTRCLRSRVLLGHREEPPNRLEYPGPLGNKQRETPLKPAWESKKIDFVFLRGEMVFVLIICS